MTAIDPAAFRRRLISWYRRRRRDLPWRSRPTLYHTLVSEFMLQQTRVDQMLPYYRRFLRAFPSMTALARAPLSHVVKLWEGLGYYRRAEYLHRTARRLQGNRKINLDDLRACPGIGPYTLAAVGSIVYGKAIPVVDGNVRRVVARLIALKQLPTSPVGQRRIDELLRKLIAPRTPGDFNQAMMELGATVCIPADPDCADCPLTTWCKAYQANAQGRYPVRAATKKRPHHHIAAAVIHRRDGRILIAQRLPDGLLPNLWEFPGGKLEPGETLAECCRREIAEELAIEIRVGTEFHVVDHAYSHYSVTVHFFRCDYVKGAPKRLGCQDFAWVDARDLRKYPFPRANKSVVDMLASQGNSKADSSYE